MTLLPASAASGLGDRFWGLATSRDPAGAGESPGYLWKGRTGPFTLGVPAAVFAPSRTSEALRSAP